MSASASLIPELEDVIQHGSREKRAETRQAHRQSVRRRRGAASTKTISACSTTCSCRLVAEIEAKARAELSQTLAPIANAPVEVMRQLAQDDDIAVAGPVLAQSPRLDESDLVEIAKTKGQAHLLAIAGRDGIGEAVTDVLVRRGDREVVRNVADNQSAQAVRRRLLRAGEARRGRRRSWPRRSASARTFRRTCSATCWCARPTVVQQRLLAAAKPETAAEIQRVLDKVSQRGRRQARRRATTRAAHAHRAGDASGRQARRGGARRLRQRQEVRGDGGGAGGALRRADRGRRPPDGAASGPIRS